MSVGKQHIPFLKDVALLAFTAFGGPNVHISLMLDHLVQKKKYLSENELMELMGLCQLLPGPTSTQTITSIGYRQGGPLLALITLFIWGLPAVILMTLLALLYQYFTAQGMELSFFRFIPPLAVGFIAYAAFSIGNKVISDWLTNLLFLGSAVAAILISSPLVFPAVIVAGGLITNFFRKAEAKEIHPRQKPNWIYLILYVGLFVASGLIAVGFNYKPVVLFENFYRFGSLVFGGGQVLIPMMMEQFTQHHQYLSETAFMTGYGIVQGTPGPVFSFCAFAGGMALQEGGTGMILLGSLIGTVGIFLPGTLLIFFVYPLWQYLKQYPWIQRAMPGINAAAGGLVLAAVYLMFLSLQIDISAPETKDFLYLGIAVAGFALLQFTKIPGPLLVLVALVAGFVF